MSSIADLNFFPVLPRSVNAKRPGDWPEAKREKQALRDGVHENVSRNRVLQRLLVHITMRFAPNV